MILTEREAFIWPSKFCSVRNKFFHLKHKELQYPVDRKYMYSVPMFWLSFMLVYVLEYGNFCNLNLSQRQKWNYNIIVHSGMSKYVYTVF